MLIKEYFNGIESNILSSKQEAIKSATGWLEILQESLLEEQEQGQQSYRSDLVGMAQTMHNLNTMIMADAEELNNLTSQYGITYEAE